MIGTSLEVQRSLEWEWLWFLVGMSVYMLKRAYYLVTGPNPVAKNYAQFIKKCWIPLLCRATFDSGIYWISFYPNLATPLLKHFGWDINVQYNLLHIGPAALFFGMGVDSVVDLLVSKVPYIKDWLPQMPPPLPKAPLPPLVPNPEQGPIQ